MKKTKSKKNVGKNSRGTWFGVNPVTRVVQDKTKYNRNRQKKEADKIIRSEKY